MIFSGGALSDNPNFYYTAAAVTLLASIICFIILISVESQVTKVITGIISAFLLIGAIVLALFGRDARNLKNREASQALLPSPRSTGLRGAPSPRYGPGVPSPRAGPGVPSPRPGPGPRAGPGPSRPINIPQRQTRDQPSGTPVNELSVSEFDRRFPVTSSSQFDPIYNDEDLDFIRDQNLAMQQIQANRESPRTGPGSLPPGYSSQPGSYTGSPVGSPPGYVQPPPPVGSPPPEYKFKSPRGNKPGQYGGECLLKSKLSRYNPF